MTGVLAEISQLHLVGVALGAGLGAVLRAAVDRFIVLRRGSTRLPWATLGVNVAGSLLLGLVLAVDQVPWAEATDDPAEAVRTLHLVVGTGFCGGLTTFSTYSVESFLMLLDGRRRAALGYAALTVGLGMLAVVAGWSIGSAIG